MIKAPHLPDVSRETMDKLEAFSALVEKWTQKINLISAQSRGDLWQRHILDSAQVYGLAPKGSWLDIGSGGGFPGIVAAIIARGLDDPRQFTLVDSDQRKCVFLRTAARELDLDVSVISERIEAMPSACARVLSARALADLGSLLSHAERHLSPDGTALFMKGKAWREEHSQAQVEWSYDLDAIISESNPEAVILRIKGIRRV